MENRFQKFANRFAKFIAPDEPWRAIDYDKPIDELRNDIAALPEDQKKKALDIWADKQVAKERERGFKTYPNPARGIIGLGGLLDEGAALFESGLNAISGGRIGAPYDEALAVQRARERAERAANPGLALASDVAGGIVGGAPLARLATGAPTVLGNIGRGATYGASLGAVEGYTRGEGGVGERLENAAETAKFGGVAGAVLPIAGAAAARGYGAAREYVEPLAVQLRRGPEEAADAILANRMAREGLSPSSVRLDLQRGQTNAVMSGGASLTGRGSNISRAELPETIADVSDGFRRLTGSVYRAGGEAGDFARTTLERRQRGAENPWSRTQDLTRGQRERILDASERALLLRGADNARRTDMRLMMEQRRLSEPLYREAYENFDAFDLDPAIKATALVAQQYSGRIGATLQRAINLFRKSGPKGNQPFWVDDIRRFDAAKKELDDMIATARSSGQQNLTRELTEFKERLLNAVHGVDEAGRATRNLTYQQARQTWGSAAENREALELGRNAFKQDSDVTVDAYRELSSGQQQLFRIGFLSGLRREMARTRPGNDATQLFQEPRVRELMREIIPASARRGNVFYDRSGRFGDVLRREQRMAQTRNVVLGNSSTAMRQADDLNLAAETMSSMWDRLRAAPSFFNMGLEAVGSAIRSVFGYRQDVAMALAQRLLTQDRTVQNQILRRLQRRGGPDVFARFLREIDNGSARLSIAMQPAIASATTQDK